ncbi:MAG: bifunctional 3-deoxy-7-phosphoheptulonate synthase/chorismate mutase type II [Prevotellaceae bacterium]|nr:bifunctional 3-deoxy-7-phosphoheptulonate synthase/chorismate mutase type II [Prevotellaceae bacterium]
MINNLKDCYIIAGPCAAESESQVMETATLLASMGITTFRVGVWKPRTHPGCFEGRGEEALKWLGRVKKDLSMKVAVEVATPEHVRLALDYGVDILWIGARTTANPFLVQAIADELSHVSRDIQVFVKNPTNPDVDLWIGSIERIKAAGISKIAAVHRGFSTYGRSEYRNNPMWQLPMDFRRRMPEIPLLCDPSHIGGKRELVAPISQQALDLGFDGLMIECHCSPEKALSDSQQQLMPKELGAVLASLTVRDHDSKLEQINILRKQIDELDSQMIDVIARRMEICREIGRYKKENNMTVFQSNRYKSVLERLMNEAQKRNVDADCVKAIFEAIHEESVRQQSDLKFTVDADR